MIDKSYHILLADDDADDCFFFEEILADHPVNTILHTVHNGTELMRVLSDHEIALPDVLFLDLNMPRKNGTLCLTEIKNNIRLHSLPVIVYSTSFDEAAAHLLYEKGAHHYICKPGDFLELRKVVLEALNSITKNNAVKPSKENFIIKA